MQRIVIDSKDVEILMGVCNRTARRILTKARKHLGKAPKEKVSISQFCEYAHLPEEEVRMGLKGRL